MKEKQKVKKGKNVKEVKFLLKESRKEGGKSENFSSMK